MKYRIRPYDELNDIWLVQKRFFLFFWCNIGVGPKEWAIQKVTKLSKGLK